MYKSILCCLDNSEQSLAASDIGLMLAAKTGAPVTGCHVYAARLHDERFRQMESVLPERYQTPEELGRQRAAHGSLIARGLEIISDSYLDAFRERAASLGLKAGGVSLEGKNFEEILKEGASGGYDLIVLGANGLGRTEAKRVGSVCARVVRGAAIADVLVVKDAEFRAASKRPVVAAIDGSAASFAALESAFTLSRALGCEVHAISAYDTLLHQTAFRSLAGVLSPEAGRLFKFKEQEALHEEVIDRGLSMVCRRHLERAVEAGRRAGVDVSATLLSGKAVDEVLRYANDADALVLVVGRTGAHAIESLDIGSVAEACAGEARCNVLVANGGFKERNEQDGRP